MRQCREVVWYGRRRRVLFGGGCSPCTDCAGQGELELILTVKIESGHPVEDPFGREFSSIYIVREL